MPVMLFRLRGVPVEEAEDIRRLLNEHAIGFYETDAGNWGISMPAIWLRDEDRLAEARMLIDEYQSRLEQGETYAAWTNIVEHPIRFLLVLAALGLILYLTLAPFFDFSR